MQFLSDLEKRDATEVFGKDPKKHYRWCSAANKGLRERQGYTVTDDPKIKSGAPGGGKVWGAEGKQAKIANREMVLMEMPKELFELIQKVRREKQDAAQNQQYNDARRKANRVDPQMGGVLSDDDDFVKELRGAS